MKILLATDGSRFSARAASYLAKYRGVFGTTKQIVLLYVDPLLPRSIEAEWDPEEAPVITPKRRTRQCGRRRPH